MHSNVSDIVLLVFVFFYETKALKHDLSYLTVTGGISVYVCISMYS